MKLAFPLRTFSLRALLVAMTLVAIGFALVRHKLVEEQRQARLLDHAMKMVLHDQGGEGDAWVLMWTYGGSDEVGLDFVPGLLTDQSARALVEAKRIVELTSDSAPPPAVESILSDAFKPGQSQDGSLIWERK
ncbi:MAG: hypothetical protein U0836_10605 [Pirellulales bacterium]